MIKLFSNSEGLIYPGIMTSIEDLKAHFQKKQRNEVRKPKMRIYHSKEMWEILMDFPGIEKKDLTAKIKDQILMICAPTHSYTGNEVNSEKCWYERHVELPSDADLLFVTAQFINGVLKINIPRTSAPEPMNIDHVTIY